MARGGERTGQTGKAYSNRTDLAMSGDTSTHMAGGSAGMRGSGTSNTELQQGSAPAPASQSAESPAPASAAPAPGNLTPLDAPGGGGGMLDLGGRQPIFPRDPDTLLRSLYAMFGHDDIRELLERRQR